MTGTGKWIAGLFIACWFGVMSFGIVGHALKVARVIDGVPLMRMMVDAFNCSASTLPKRITPANRPNRVQKRREIGSSERIAGRKVMLRFGLVRRDRTLAWVYLPSGETSLISTSRSSPLKIAT